MKTMERCDNIGFGNKYFILYMIADILSFLPAPFTLYGWWGCRALFWCSFLTELIAMTISFCMIGKKIIYTKKVAFSRILLNTFVMPYSIAMCGLVMLEHGNDVTDSILPFTSPMYFIGAGVLFIAMTVTQVIQLKRNRREMITE